MNGLKRAFATFGLAAVLIVGLVAAFGIPLLVHSHNAKIQRLLAPAEQPKP